MIVVLGSPVVKNLGSCRLIAFSFYVKISLGVMLFLAGMNKPWLLLVIMMVDEYDVYSTFIAYLLGPLVSFIYG